MDKVIQFLNESKEDISHFEGDGTNLYIYMKNGDTVEFHAMSGMETHHYTD